MRNREEGGLFGVEGFFFWVGLGVHYLCVFMCISGYAFVS
jgi:hypothetical protein